MGVYVMVQGYAAQHLDDQAKLRPIPLPIRHYHSHPQWAFFWRRPIFGNVASLYLVDEYGEALVQHEAEHELIALCAQAGAVL